jgi:hypothetical protein
LSVALRYGVGCFCDKAYHQDIVRSKTDYPARKAQSKILILLCGGYILTLNIKTPQKCGVFIGGVAEDCTPVRWFTTTSDYKHSLFYVLSFTFEINKISKTAI